MVKSSYFKLIILVVVIKSYISQGGMNSCGTVGDRQPQNKTQCTSPQKSLGEGEKCCYISAFLSGQPISACVILPKDQDEATIKNAAEKIGSNSTYSCKGSWLLKNFLAYLCAIVVLILM
jgi:hypothetical protein